MTDVAASGAAQDATTSPKASNASNKADNEPQMPNVKTEDVSGNVADATASAIADPQGEEGDSEAETLIQSPEKKKNIVENAPVLRPTSSAAAAKGTESASPSLESKKASRKRKRDAPDDGNGARSGGSSSSPLSSPNLQAHSRDSDSDISDTPRSARSVRLRRSAPKPELDGTGVTSQSKAKRRRPSDIIPPTKHRTRGSVGNIEVTSEFRETRSATYPRQSSDDRSPSPRPSSSRQEHKRGASTQITIGDVERRKRGRPPNITTRHSKTTEREDTSDDADDSSPAPRSRTHLDRHDSRYDHMSPAKPAGPRKRRDKNGRTYLSRACNNEDLEKAKICLEERPEDLNEPDNAGNTPLQIAALEGFTDIVRFLLEAGADVDSKNVDKDTPLIDAVENGHFEAVKLLLQHGANPRLANAKGDEPFDLVPADDENYKQTRKMIADAKEQDFSKRRKSSDNDNNGGSSRAASAASARDSPPVTGPRSPPGLASSRRRTGRSESTRNDLLWQQNTQENLQALAAKGNVQGVATILNVLSKAEPVAVIAAAKAGHDDVLNYMLAIGNADPDPEPQTKFKPGYNTPMLAAIGRGNLKVVELLVEQTGFNPSKKYRGRTYFEISAERKGEGWQKEFDILKDAYEKYTAGKPKTKSPRKVRDQVLDRPREKRLRRSESPLSSNLRTSSSPTITHKSLPEKSPRSGRKDIKQGSPSVDDMNVRRAESIRDDANVAVASDQEQTVHDKRGHKHRRSQSDMPLPPNLEAEVTQRRRRLVTGKEHRRSQSGAGTGQSDGSSSEIEIKREKNLLGLKRNRSSVSPEPSATGSDRVVVKKRRTVLESSPEESRPAASTKSSEMDPSIEETAAKEEAIVEAPVNNQPQLQQNPPDPDTGAEQSVMEVGQVPVTTMDESADLITEQDAPGEPDTATPMPVEWSLVPPSRPEDVAQDRVQTQQEDELKLEQQRASEAQAAKERQEAEQTAALERAAAEKAAAEQAEAERIAAEKAAAEKEEQEKRAAEEAEVKRKIEEAEAKRKAEEDAAARKREQEAAEELRRREMQRRQEEQIRQQHLEIERRRREALPSALATAAWLIENGDARARSHEWLSHFLPLRVAYGEQLEAWHSSSSPSKDLWLPNFQVATLLATKDLNLRNYTSLDKLPCSKVERERLWKTCRNVVSYDFDTNSFNTSIKQAKIVDVEQEPKFMSMAELFWVKLSDFEDQVARQVHLSGLVLAQTRLTITATPPYVKAIAAPRSNGFDATRFSINGNGIGNGNIQEYAKSTATTVFNPTSNPYANTNGGYH